MCFRRGVGRAASSTVHELAAMRPCAGCGECVRERCVRALEEAHRGHSPARQCVPCGGRLVRSSSWLAEAASCAEQPFSPSASRILRTGQYCSRFSGGSGAGSGRGRVPACACGFPRHPTPMPTPQRSLTLTLRHDSDEDTAAFLYSCRVHTHELYSVLYSQQYLSTT